MFNRKIKIGIRYTVENFLNIKRSLKDIEKYIRSIVKINGKIYYVVKRNYKYFSHLQDLTITLAGFINVENYN